MEKLRCLFLGYSSKQTKIIKFLKDKKITVDQNRNKKTNSQIINKYDLCISYGYRRILNYKTLKQLKRPIVNLHISYLPYNKGIYPNLNAFINNTPKGVTIHEIDKGIDTGKIIFQKKINLKISEKTTFRDTYKILRNEMEKLFFKHFKSLILNNYKSFNQKKINLKKYRTYKNKINWNIPIKSFLNKNFKKNAY
tara:strand:- start:436 stop:1020 length:585 start_codon:yes stop_codon:yes gene_type:complete